VAAKQGVLNCQTDQSLEGEFCRMGYRKLLDEIRISNRQKISPGNIVRVLWEYRPLGRYMLIKFGWKSWYSFWYTKLFVADEGGEYSLLNHVFRRFPGILGNPYKLEAEHSTICDKECIFCEHTHWVGEKTTRITLDHLKQTADCLPKLKWMNVTGEGSNFLNKDFIPIIKYLRSRHINVNFVDEFDFLTEDIARQIIELGINSIYISFDAATKSTYESIKKGCNFDTALNNIRTMLRLKEELNSPFPVLHFRYIITTLNYREMPEFIELIASLKGRGVRARVEFVGLLTFPGIESYYIPLDQLPEDLLVRTFTNALKHRINLYFSHAGSHLPAMERCSAWTEPYVLIGGEVVSCCAIIMSNKRKFLRENSFGNVYTTPFMDIWNSPRYRDFRRSVNDPHAKVPKTCYGCRAYDTTQRAERFGVED
jgi:MoaA/NifB/PqqE/SkfB family radical SAM enzyme